MKKFTISKQPTFEFEDIIWENGQYAVGMDEVGRGPLAGPVTVSVVVYDPKMTDKLRKQIEESGIQDSKKLSEKQRLKLVPFIKETCISWAVASSSVDVINNNGITQAILYALKQSLDIIHPQIAHPYHLLVDGLEINGLDMKDGFIQKSIIKGDSRCISIAAASILAKVERDAYMCHLAQDFPLYNWEKNKGYGTKKHREAIMKYGITSHHRLLYVRNIIGSISPHQRE